MSHIVLAIDFLSFELCEASVGRWQRSTAHVIWDDFLWMELYSQLYPWQRLNQIPGFQNWNLKDGFALNIKNEIQERSFCFYQRHMFSIMQASKPLNSGLTTVGWSSPGF